MPAIVQRYRTVSIRVNVPRVQVREIAEGFAPAGKKSIWKPKV
jgi:hypothetical protein